MCERQNGGPKMPPGWSRRITRLGTLAILALAGRLSGQSLPDLSVIDIRPPSGPAVGVAGDFTIHVNSAGGSGVWVTAIFLPAVTITSGNSTAGPCLIVPTGSDPSTTVM